MRCDGCGSEIEQGSAFCPECGKASSPQAPESAPRSRKLFAIATLAAALIAVAGIGYYKFYLPGGVAAFVNGERITLAELEAETGRIMAAQAVPVKVADSPAAKALRTEVLNRMIAERVALQEANKAGIEISSAEVAETVNGMRASSGLDEAGFAAAVTERYGSRTAFEKRLEQDLLIRKFLTAKVIPRGADAAAAGAAVNQWLQERTRNASVRIALAEQVSGAGCGCCNNGPAKGAPGAGSTSKEQAAVEAGMRYWSERGNGGTVTARTKDYGCHVQVDLMKKDKVVLSLRFQDGTITEL